jgi:hypothetical protein
MKRSEAAIRHLYREIDQHLYKTCSRELDDINADTKLKEKKTKNFLKDITTKTEGASLTRSGSLQTVHIQLCGVSASSKLGHRRLAENWLEAARRTLKAEGNGK